MELVVDVSITNRHNPGTTKASFCHKHDASNLNPNRSSYKNRFWSCCYSSVSRYILQRVARSSLPIYSHSNDVAHCVCRWQFPFFNFIPFLASSKMIDRRRIGFVKIMVCIDWFFFVSPSLSPSLRLDGMKLKGRDENCCRGQNIDWKLVFQPWLQHQTIYRWHENWPLM